MIALRRARQGGQSLPGVQKTTGRLSYRFKRTAVGLGFERFVVAGDKELRVEGTLSSFSAATPDLRLAITQEDLAVELAAGVRGSNVIPPLVAPRLLEVLAACPDVRLDGAPVKASGPCSPFRAVVEDCAEGFRTRLEQNPAVTDVFANAIVLCGASLHALGDSPLNAREIEEFRVGRVTARDRVAELLTDLMPWLQERVPVHVATRKLPKVVSDVSPHVALETRRDGDRLVVLPSIVYGDPALARLDGDRITHLSGAVPLRHRETEQRLTQQLEEIGLAPGRRSSLPAQDAIALMERIEAHRLRDVELSGEGTKGFYLAPALSAKLKIKGDSFDVRFETMHDGKKTRADAGAVMRAWSSGEPLVALSGGGFAPLPTDWLARYGSQIADLIAAREASRSDQLPPCALPDLARLCEALELAPPPGFDRLRTLAESFDKLPHAPLPEDFSGQLRAYQRIGVDWLCFLRDAGLGAMLADDMGLGKTVEALCAVRGRTLVVAPTSVLHNWADEISRFRPGLRVCRYHGAQRTLESECEVVITTYAILRIDIDRLAQETWDTVVLDEAQAIKNPESQVAQAALRLSAQFRMTLTGTPVENRLDELWSQMHFLNPGLLGGRRDFQERYARTISEGEPGAARRLRERIRPFVLRRLKSEVAPELPPRTEVVLRCTLSDEERAVYEAIRAASVPGVIERLREGAGVFAALEALLRLRQACCHCALVPGQSAETSSKLDLLVGMLDESLAGGHKALVFSQWTSLLDLLEPQLQQGGHAVLPSRRVDEGPGSRGAGVPGRAGAADHDHLAEGGRHRPEPDRGGSRVPAGSIGGTPQSRIRQPTGRIASASSAPCSCTSSWPRPWSRKGFSRCSSASEQWPTLPWARRIRRPRSRARIC